MVESAGNPSCDDCHAIGMQVRAQWIESYGVFVSKRGIICCGQEQTLRMMLGSITDGLSVATSKEAYVVMAGGYSIGAGSKLGGSETGRVFEGFPRRYSQAITL